ncbi:hypothetical protein JCM9279_004549 [Rhodotorula babjevae]
MHHLEHRDGPAAKHHDLHKRGMHKRQRVAATTDAATTTTAARTTRRRATTTTAAATVLESAADLAATTSTTFQPGVAASGTATKSVGNAPPTRSRTHTSGSYSFSFAAESSGLPRSSAVAVTVDSSPNVDATGLPTGAIYGIAIGGGVLAVIILAGIGICCWKKRKNGKKVDAVGGWTNLGDNGRGGPGPGQSRPVELSNAAAWASSDTLGAGPYGGDSKPWAQQSFSSLASHDEKGRGAHGRALPVFAPQAHDAARRELLGGPPARSATEQSFPRSATGASLASSAPASGGDRARPATGAQSVNDVITFRGQQAAPLAAPVAQPAPARLPSRSSPSSSPTSRADVPLPPSTPQQPPPAARTAQPTHLSYNGVPVGPQPITASAYPARRPSHRPSEVPSAGGADAGAPASPYAFARRPEQAQRDTQELASDERLAGRFMEVMTGQVGREEQERERRKKDTIMGLTDAYGGEADSDDDDEEERDHVVGLPSHPLPASTRTSAPSNPRRYSARVDSKPLRELEAMFDQFPPRHQPHQQHGVRASEASDLSGLAAAAGVRLGGSTSPSYRTSDASSMYASPPQQHAPSVTVAPLGFTRRPLGPVPESDSKDSLSPLSAATSGSGAHSPYGATQRYEHSIYSAAGEVGELSSNSIAGSARSSPAKDGSVLGQRQPSSSVPGAGPSGADVFGPSTITPPARQSSVKGAALQRKVSTRPTAPAPLRLARNTSLAQPQQRSAHDEPSMPAGEDRRNPLTLSTAERDVLQQLGLPATPELSSSRDSPRSSPSSVASSPSLATPQTPVFHFSHPSTHSHPHDPTVRSFMDVSPSPSPSRDAFTQHKAPQIVVVDPVGAGGFDSLDVMAGKQGQQDASYRSATMSLYGMYE